MPGLVLRKWLLTTLLVACFFNTYSQDLKPVDTAYNAAKKQSYAERNKLFLADLKTSTTDKGLSKHYEQHYKALFEALHEFIKEGQLTDIPALQHVLEKVVEQITTNNTTVPKDVEVFLLRREDANALIIGDNTIFANIGLFNYLYSEEELAAVLSHEIAHLVLVHHLKGLRNSYENDKESKADVKTIKSLEVKKSDRAFEALKNSFYKNREMKRYYEWQADSAGYVFFKNAGYNPLSFINALANIEKADTVFPGVLLSETYKMYFEIPEQHFQDKWLDTEDFSSYNYGSFTNKFNKDSMATHAEMNDRIQQLKSVFPELAQPQNNGNDAANDSFRVARMIAKNEWIPNLYFNERYGEVVYASLIQLQENPADTTSKAWMSKGLEKIYEARRDYKMNKYLDRVVPQQQPESYIRFLNFMWNLKLDEIKNISLYYSDHK